MVDTTLVGVVMNGLSHFCAVQDKSHFAVCLIRGLGGNLPEAMREKFAADVSGLFTTIVFIVYPFFVIALLC